MTLPTERKLGEYMPMVDQRTVLVGKTWADFEALLAERGARSAPRFTYLDGAIELMSPSRDHDQVKSILGHLVEAYCLERGILVAPAGSWLLRTPQHEAGLEPDECYVLGAAPSTKTRPDLAIEVTWTRGGIAKLEAYRRVLVPEVWFWENDALAVFVLAGSDYERRATSACLSGLDLALIARLARAASLNEAMAAFRAALR